MRKKWTKAAAMALIAAQLLLPVRAAALVTGDGHVIRNPEVLEAFTFPENWSEDALRFCVGNGIMEGRGKSLADTANATRAEMATMLVQLLGLTEQADLSAYRDASPADWFYEPMAKAVAAGIVSGTSENTLSPNARITREQVVAMLSRAFALNPENPKKWREFADSAAISDYARSAVSALAERGCLTGYSDGTVKPRANITRAEIAQIFYSLFTCIAHSPAELPQSGQVLYRGTEPIPAGTALEGSLTVSGSGALTDLSVTDTLTLQGSSFELSGVTAKNLSAAVGTQVSGDAAVETIRVSGQESVIGLDADTVLVYGDATLTGTYGQIVIWGEDLALTLDGTAEHVEARGNGVTVRGSGSAKTVELFGRASACAVEAEEVFDRYNEARQEALDTVETLEVWDTVIRDTALYSGSNLTGKICDLPAGTMLDHYYYYEDEPGASVYLEDGTFGYVPIEDIEIPTECDIREEPYEDRIVEAFVNVKGYESPTPWLIWVSLKTQMTYVFSGSQDNWVLERSFPCCTGKNSTPTVRGIFDVDYHYYEWNFGDYKVKNVTGFYEGYAFHSITYTPDYSEVIDGTIGYPASHGCVRMMPEDCGFIFNEIPYHTTVVTY